MSSAARLRAMRARRSTWGRSCQRAADARRTHDPRQGLRPCLRKAGLHKKSRIRRKQACTKIFIMLKTSLRGVRRAGNTPRAPGRDARSENRSGGGEAVRQPTIEIVAPASTAALHAVLDACRSLPSRSSLARMPCASFCRSCARAVAFRPGCGWPRSARGRCAPSTRKGFDQVLAPLNASTASAARTAAARRRGRKSYPDCARRRRAQTARRRTERACARVAYASVTGACPHASRMRRSSRACAGARSIF